MQNALASITLSALSAGNRELVLPARLEVRLQHRTDMLLCTDILRVLPGKRWVFKALWHEREVLVKLFLGAAAGKHLRRETAGIEALQQAEILAPRLLATGNALDGAAPLAVLEYLPNALSLNGLWRTAADDQARRTLLQQAVGLIAAMHNKGIGQQDIHLDNFMLARRQLFVIDGGAVTASKNMSALSGSKSLQNLGLFLAQLYPLGDALITGAIEGYCRARKWDSKSRLKPALAAVMAQRHQRLRRFSNKTMRESTQFSLTKNRRKLMICQRNQLSDALTALLDAPDSFIAKGTLLKDGNSASVALVRLEDGRQLVVKRYNIKGGLHRIKRWLRKSRAEISWRNANLLRFSGISTATPIALIEERWGPLRGRAYFISDFLPGMAMRELLETDETPAATRDAAIRSLQECFTAMAALRISHGDCKATNFIWTGKEISLIDLDAMRLHQSKACFARAQRRDVKRLMQNWRNNPELSARFRAWRPDTENHHLISPFIVKLLQNFRTLR